MKSQLFLPMQELFDALNCLKWVIKCKPIPNASVPLLKLEIDPMIDFEGNSKYWDLNFPISKYQSK
mgnify:CR=1 FL=1